MTRYLLRAAKDPRTAVGPEAALAHSAGGLFGSNIGNVLFADSVHRMLSTPDAEVVPDSYLTEKYSSQWHIARINRKFDHFVLPLANAFRETFVTSLTRLSDVIEKLTIPVTVVGAGAQFRIGREERLSDDAERAVKRFVAAVLDRSAKIGVRGDTTRRFLRTLGFGDEHVEVIGCPAVYLRGPENTVIPGEAPTANSAIAMSISPYARAVSGFVRRTVEQYPRAVYFPQNHIDLALMMWGEDLVRDYDATLPTHTQHVLYQEGRMRFPLDSRTWVDALADFDYAVGTRIHGTIAALLSRTPATILAFDSRTLELAEYHDIPRQTLQKVGKRVTVDELFDKSDWSAYNRGLPHRFEQLTSFLEANGISHIGQPGRANPAYDAQIAAAPLPAPVRPLVPASPSYEADLGSRVRWLRHRSTAAALRSEGRYKPPFAPAGYGFLRRNEPEPRRALRDVVAKSRDEAGRVAALQMELARRAAAGKAATPSPPQPSAPPALSQPDR